MESNRPSKFYETIQKIESVVIEEYSDIEILISPQNENLSSENLFLKGDFILSNDRIVFKGIYRMEYFAFYVRIYNLLSITRNADYIAFSISDLANVIQNHLIDRGRLFDAFESERDIRSELALKVKSHIQSQSSQLGKSPEARTKWTEQFKSGQEFELIGDFQIRVIMRDQVDANGSPRRPRGCTGSCTKSARKSWGPT